MARIGSNLNQIAHKLHLFHPVDAAELMPNALRHLVTLNKIMVHLICLYRKLLLMWIRLCKDASNYDYITY